MFQLVHENNVYILGQGSRKTADRLKELFNKYEELCKYDLLLTQI